MVRDKKYSTLRVRKTVVWDGYYFEIDIRIFICEGRLKSPVAYVCSRYTLNFVPCQPLPLPRNQSAQGNHITWETEYPSRNRSSGLVLNDRKPRVSFSRRTDEILTVTRVFLLRFRKLISISRFSRFQSLVGLGLFFFLYIVLDFYELSTPLSLLYLSIEIPERTLVRKTFLIWRKSFSFDRHRCRWVWHLHDWSLYSKRLRRFLV